MKSHVVIALACIAASSFADNSKFTHYPLKDAASGKATSLSSLKGKCKAIYIDFFANWCGPCQGEIDKVIQLNKQFGGKGVAFVGLDVWEPWSAMQQDIRKKHIPYRVMHDDAKAPAGVLQILGLQQIPVVIILDGRTLAEKGRWTNGLDPSGKAEAQQVKLLHSMGVK